jgi:hypothetical protein
MTLGVEKESCFIENSISFSQKRYIPYWGLMQKFNNNTSVEYTHNRFYGARRHAIKKKPSKEI